MGDRGRHSAWIPDGKYYLKWRRCFDSWWDTHAGFLGLQSSLYYSKQHMSAHPSKDDSALCKWQLKSGNEFWCWDSDLSMWSFRARSRQSFPLALSASKVALIRWRMDGGILKALDPVWDVMLQSDWVKNGTTAFSFWQDRRRKERKRCCLQTFTWRTTSCNLFASPPSYLHYRRIDLEDVLLPCDLPDADLAGELRRGVAVSLQREGTLQGTLVAGPHLRKGELLREDRRRADRMNIMMKGFVCRDWKLIKFQQKKLVFVFLEKPALPPTLLFYMLN